MPTIECTIRRDGDTPITIGKTTYLFTPVPGYPDGFPTTSICKINKKEDVDYLMSHNQFRNYIPERTQKELVDKGNPMQGYAIEKKGNEGYVVVDRRDINHVKYFGSNETWMDNLTGCKPYLSEIEAYEGLKMEVGTVEQLVMETDTPDTTSTKDKVTVCAYCGKDCTTASGLSAHLRYRSKNGDVCK